MSLLVVTTAKGARDLIMWKSSNSVSPKWLDWLRWSFGWRNKANSRLTISFQYPALPAMVASLGKKNQITSVNFE